MKPNIEVHIDRLVIENISVSNLHLLKEAIEQQLAEHFSSEGLSSSLTQDQDFSIVKGESIQFQTGDMNMHGDFNSVAVGKGLADSVYNRLKNINERSNSKEHKNQ
jgi:hypothetical protein